MRLPSLPLSRENIKSSVSKFRCKAVFIYWWSLRNGVVQELIIPVSLLALLTNSIVDGNAVHAREMAKRQNAMTNAFLPALDTFTIPQGIEALGGVIHEIDYRSVRGVTWKLLPQHIQHAIDSEFIAHLPVVFFVLIIVERAVLIVHERENGTIAILDSHSHVQGRKGAAILLSVLRSRRRSLLSKQTLIFKAIRYTSP
ncbi:hypothetical protein COOONC_12580 [Cooperia oncophora]